MSRRASKHWEHDSFAAGMVQDVPRHLLPEQAVWDALDVFIDEDGKLSKRGGTSAALASANAIVPVSLMIMRSFSDDQLITGYIQNDAGGYNAFTPSTGTSSLGSTSSASLNASGFISGGPVTHGNFVVFPKIWTGTSASARSVVFGGASLSVAAGALSGALTVTQNSKTITGFAAGDFSNIEVGGFLSCTDATHDGLYRIVSTNSGASSVDVEPTPTISFAPSVSAYLQGRLLSTNSASAFPILIDGATAASHQNRLVLGDVAITSSGSQVVRLQNRLAWSRLPTETGFTVGSVTLDGLHYFTSGLAYVNASLNYLDIVGMTRIIQPVSLDANRLLVLGSNTIAVVSGLFSTISSTNTTLGLSVENVPQAVGCISAKGVQSTVGGVLFPSNSAVFAFEGSRAVNVMRGRIVNYWQSLIQAGATIYGSSILDPDHYYISTSGGGLLCNLDGYRWTRISNVNIVGGVRDPGSDTQIYAARANATSSSQTYKLTKIHTITHPSSSFTSDADGAAVTSTVKTKVYTDGDATRLKRIKHVKAAASAATSGTITITGTPGLEAEETTFTVGTITGNAGGTPQVVQADPSTAVLTRGVAYTLAQTGACATAEYLSVAEDVRELAEKRIT